MLSICVDQKADGLPDWLFWQEEYFIICIIINKAGISQESGLTKDWVLNGISFNNKRGALHSASFIMHVLFLRLLRILLLIQVMNPKVFEINLSHEPPSLGLQTIL